jgi:hypothetical protein
LTPAGVGDAVHDHAEDDGRYDHRNQLEERIAQNLELDGEGWLGHAQNNAQQKCDDDLKE